MKKFSAVIGFTYEDAHVLASMIFKSKQMRPVKKFRSSQNQGRCSRFLKGYSLFYKPLCPQAGTTNNENEV